MFIAFKCFTPFWGAGLDDKAIWEFTYKEVYRAITQST